MLIPRWHHVSADINGLSQIWSCPCCHRSCSCAGRVVSQETEHTMSVPHRTLSVLKLAVTKLIKPFRRGHFGRNTHSDQSDSGSELDSPSKGMHELSADRSSYRVSRSEGRLIDASISQNVGLIVIARAHGLGMSGTRPDCFRVAGHLHIRQP